MTAHFLIDAWRFRFGVFRFTQFDLSLHSGKAWGTVVENLFRPSECVTDVGSFDSVRLMPHSAHDDSAFLDRRSSTGEDARHSIVLFLLLVALGQELILALFGLREDGGVFGK